MSDYNIHKESTVDLLLHLKAGRESYYQIADRAFKTKETGEGTHQVVHKISGLIKGRRASDAAIAETEYAKTVNAGNIEAAEVEYQPMSESLTATRHRNRVGSKYHPTWKTRVEWNNLRSHRIPGCFHCKGRHNAVDCERFYRGVRRRKQTFDTHLREVMGT